MLGNLLSGIVRVVNAPIRAFENIACGETPNEDERIFSAPLDTLAEELERADED